MHKTILLVLRLVVAAILIQTLRFKFTAHPDSVYIFTQVGLEPFGRIGIGGVLELIFCHLDLNTKICLDRRRLNRRYYWWGHHDAFNQTWC